MKFKKESVFEVLGDWLEENTHLVEGLCDRINDLDDTPEKVVVPKFVAVWG